MGKTVVVTARIPSYGSEPIEGPGQVIELQHMRNDPLLLKHGYVREVEKGESVYTCDPCGRRFLGDVTSGPAKAHLERARHDLAKVDLDEPARSRRGPKPKARVPKGDDPDNDDPWDLEPNGPPAPEKDPGGKVEVRR